MPLRTSLFTRPKLLRPEAPCSFGNLASISFAEKGAIAVVAQQWPHDSRARLGG